MKKIIILALILLTTSYLKSQPVGLQSIDVDMNNATLTWREAEERDFYQLYYLPALANQGVMLTLTDTVAYLSELTPQTRYSWRVRMINNDGDTSAWSSENYFYTLSDDTLCPRVSDMFLGNIAQNHLNIQWLPQEGTSLFQIVCGEVGSNPDNYDIIHSTQNYEYNFNQEFTEQNTYQIALRTNCSGGFSPWKYLYVKYLYQNSVFSLPLQIDFSLPTQNQNIGFLSSQNNPWQISNNNLQIYPNNPSSTSVSYAWIDFEIPSTATSFYIDFSYLAPQSENSGLKIYLLPLGTSISVDNLPSSQYQVGQEIYHSTNNQWIREHIELPNHHIGNQRRLLFAYYQRPSQNPSTIKIDDIYLTSRYCATPDSLRANYISATSAMLTWDFAENQTIFNLQYKKREDSVWSEINSITPNYLIENLTPSTEYVFKVQADCGGEESFFSEIESFTTTTLISEVENLKIEKYSYNSATISWDNNPLAEEYIVELTTNSTTTTHHTSIPLLTLSSLLPNTIYNVEVRAISQDLDTSLSQNIYLHTLCFPETNYPYYLEDTIGFSTFEGFCNFDGCWRVEADTLFSPLFDINSLSNPYLTFDYLSLIGVSSRLLVSVSQEEFQEIDFHFSNGKNTLPLINFTGENLRFAIQSSSSQTVESTYQITNFSIKDTCLSPNGVTVNQITAFSARIEWQTIDNITQYDLKIINTQNSDTLSFNNVESGFVVEDLIPMQEYKVILYSTCGLQQALNFVEEYFTTTSQSETCLMPQNFECQHFQVKGDETIVCTWDEVEDNPYIQWEIQYKERLAVNYTSAIVSLYPRFTLRNLEMGSQWDFRVRAICSVGDTSSWTPVIQVTVGEQSLQANQYSGKTVKIYPNPTDSILYIETEAIELKEAQMIDSYGRVIRAWDILPREIDVTTMEAGTYVLKFLMDNQPVTRKITIQ